MSSSFRSLIAGALLLVSGLADATAATSAGHAVGVAAPTPGPRLEDITAHEFRIGLPYDLR